MLSEITDAHLHICTLQHLTVGMCSVCDCKCCINFFCFSSTLTISYVVVHVFLLCMCVFCVDIPTGLHTSKSAGHATWCNL